MGKLPRIIQVSLICHHKAPYKREQKVTQTEEKPYEMELDVRMIQPPALEFQGSPRSWKK